MKITRMSFNSGEISPLLWWRSDLAKYSSSCKSIENFINLPQGGVRRRFGSEVIARVGDVNDASRIITWEVDRDFYFQMVFTGTQILIYDRNGAQVFVVESIPWADTDFEQLYTKQVFDVMYIAHPNYPLQKISRTESFLWTIEEVELLGGPFDDLNIITDETMSMTLAVADEVTVTSSVPQFKASDVGRLLFIRSDEINSESGNYGTGDQGLFSEALYARGAVTMRTEGGIWDGVLELQFSIDGGTTWDATGTITSSDGKHNGSIVRDIDLYGTLVRVFMRERSNTSGDTGCLWTLESNERQENVIKIHTFTDDSTVDGTLQAGDGLAVTTYAWGLGSFGEDEGYPTCVEIYEERLMLAGVKSQPSSVYGSKINYWNDFQIGTLATSPIKFTLSADVRNRIRWMVPEQNLIMGTAYGEWTIGSRDNSSSLTGENVSARRQTQFGSDPVQPINASDMTLYVEAGGKRMRSTQFSFEKDGYVSVDMSILAPHLTKTAELKRMAFSRSPDHIVWGVLTDGTLLSFTYEREHSVSAWARHPFSDNADVIDINSVLTEQGDVVSMLINRSDGQYFEIIRRDALCFDWQKLHENVQPAYVTTLKGNEAFNVYRDDLAIDQNAFVSNNSGVYIRIINVPGDLVFEYDGEQIELGVDVVDMGSDLYWYPLGTDKALVKIYDFTTELILNTDYTAENYTEIYVVDLLTEVYLPSTLTIEVSAVPLVENVDYWNMEGTFQMLIIGMNGVLEADVVIKSAGVPLINSDYDLIRPRAQVSTARDTFYTAIQMISLLETTDISNTPDSGGPGTRNKVNEIDLFVVDSVGGQVSTDGAKTFSDVKQTIKNVVAGERIPNYTGKLETLKQSGYQDEQTVAFRNESPYNQIIASIGAKIQRISE